MSTHLKLLEAWKKRAQLRTEGDKLLREAERLSQESRKLHNESNVILAKSSEYSQRTAEGIKRFNEYRKLKSVADKISHDSARFNAEAYEKYAEADLFWATAVLEAYGDIAMVWQHGDGDGLDCILGNGEVYTEQMCVENAA